MLPDRVSNPGPLTYESGALPSALHGPAKTQWKKTSMQNINVIDKQTDEWRERKAIYLSTYIYNRD